MEARGFYSEDEGATPAPMVRIGIGFGRGNVVGASALIDTGADVCVFPASMFRFRIGEKGEPIVVEMADGTRVSSRILYPSITAGDIRETGVASVILPDAVPIVGRSFLNRLEVRLTSARDLVRMATIRGARGTEA